METTFLKSRFPEHPEPSQAVARLGLWSTSPARRSQNKKERGLQSAIRLGTHKLMNRFVRRRNNRSRSGMNAALQRSSRRRRILRWSNSGELRQVGVYPADSRTHEVFPAARLAGSGRKGILRRQTCAFEQGTSPRLTATEAILR